MNQQLIDTVVHAVLYEGYILYPYRASAKKNRQRFTFGRVYPEAYSLAENGAEPCAMRTQCLVEGNPACRHTHRKVTVRFLATDGARHRRPRRAVAETSGAR